MCRTTRSSGTRGSPVILEGMVLGAVLMGTPALADDGKTDADPLSPYRTPFGVLVDRAIGSTSRPVEFDWRRTRFQVAATGDFLFELNNFNSMRAGAVFRWPSGGL